MRPAAWDQQAAPGGLFFACHYRLGLPGPSDRRSCHRHVDEDVSVLSASTWCLFGPKTVFLFRMQRATARSGCLGPTWSRPRSVRTTSMIQASNCRRALCRPIWDCSRFARLFLIIFCNLFVIFFLRYIARFGPILNHVWDEIASDSRFSHHI